MSFRYYGLHCSKWYNLGHMASAEEETTPRKRAPRKRTVRKSAPRKKAAPRRSVSAPAPRVETPEPVSTGERRAPTGLGTSRLVRRQKNKHKMVVAAIMIFGVGASAVVGYTDQGQIDVEAAAEARNERIRENRANEDDVLTSTIEVPVQNQNKQKADGGLRGLGSTETKPKPAPAPPVATSTATSSDSIASSTDATASSTVVIEDTVTASSTEEGE